MPTSEPPSVLAIVAHPDDIEFSAAGTMLLLKQAGWQLHYFNISGGDCGSTKTGRDETRRIRAAEARAAAEVLGAEFYESIGNDMLIFFGEELLRKVAAVVRQARPRIVLAHSPQDYMEDHMNACRLAVTAAFTHGMPNFATDPPVEPYDGDVTVYHAMPHGLCDGLRQPVEPDFFVDVESVRETKRQALAAHESQRSWLDESQRRRAVGRVCPCRRLATAPAPWLLRGRELPVDRRPAFRVDPPQSESQQAAGAAWLTVARCRIPPFRAAS